MTRAVLLSSRAQREFSRIEATTQARLRRSLLAYAESRVGDVKRLTGTRGRDDLFRLRVGDLRIVFAVAGGQIRVTRIIHRREGYDWL